MIKPTRIDPEKQLALRAVAELEAARDARERYDRTLQAAIDCYGPIRIMSPKYRLPNGKIVRHRLRYPSGINASNFPEEVQDQLRAYARRIGECTDRAVEYWRQSKRRMGTLRPLLEYYRTMSDGRVSYY